MKMALHVSQVNLKSDPGKIHRMDYTTRTLREHTKGEVLGLQFV